MKRARPSQLLSQAVLCSLHVTNQETSLRTIYELEDQGDGTYQLLEQFTLAANLSSRLFVGGSAAAGGVAKTFTVVPGNAYAPRCTIDRVNTSGSVRTGGAAQITVCARSGSAPLCSRDDVSSIL